MQSGLVDAIGEKVDTFAEGSSLRIETWPSRAYSASPSVFSAVEVPQSVCETIRTGALAGLHPFAIAVQLAEKLDIWYGLGQYKSGTSNAQAPMGPVETQHFVQDCWESFLGPLWDAVTVLDRKGQGSGTPDRIHVKPNAQPEAARALYPGNFCKAFSRDREVNACIHKRFWVDTQTIGSLGQQAPERGRRIH